MGVFVLVVVVCLRLDCFILLVWFVVGCVWLLICSLDVVGWFWFGFVSCFVWLLFVVVWVFNVWCCCFDFELLGLVCLCVGFWFVCFVGVLGDKWLLWYLYIIKKILA